MSTLKHFLKDTVIYGMASVLPRLINFALNAVFTGVFTTSEFSFQTKWYIYAAFINVVLTLGLETSFFRFYTTEKDKNSVISTSFMMLFITSLVFLIVGWSFSESFSAFFNFENMLIFKILIGVTFLDTLVVIPFALLRVSGRPIKFMVLKLANVLFLVTTTIFLLVIIPYLIKTESKIPEILGFSHSYEPNVIHVFIANILAGIFTLITLAPEILKIKWSIDKVLIKKLLSYGLPIMIGGLAYTINENADKLIIPKLISEDANGIYAACYKLGVFMTLYITAFRLGAEPFFFKNAGTIDAKEKYSKIMTWFVIFGSLFMLGIVSFLDPIASIIIKQDVYLSGLAIVPIILLANLFSGIYINLSIWYKLTDKTKFGMYISILGAFITIINLFIFVPWIGIYGGAVATIITYFSMSVISGYLGHKYYPVPYEVGKLLGIIIVSAILSGISFVYMRGSLLPNLVLILAYISFLYVIEKDEIKTVFKHW
ncbi:MAG: polysaccharide biosynthesis C-terminal domain-containing protein [Saprospiraceae bacterium]|nr:polysaccharide biosynthesis C-terminal domain-containing protein [Saprospiraceae bacterium]